MKTLDIKYKPIFDSAVSIAEDIAGKESSQLACIFDRWQDEKEYEDFAEYVEWAKKRFAQYPEFKFQKLTKRPFGVHGTVKGLPVEIRVTAKQVSLYYADIKFA